jgi:hypothetical protein
MKKLKALALSALLCFSTEVFSQEVPLNEPDYNKPRIFSDLPEKMDLRIPETERLFKLKAGDAVTVQLTNELMLKGTILSIGGQENSKSLVFKATNRGNAVLSISRIQIDGNIIYNGRIMNRDNGDALLIKKENDVYVVQKIGLYDLISE